MINQSIFFSIYFIIKLLVATNMLKELLEDCLEEKDINNPEIFQNIHVGIQFRFEMFKQYDHVRLCAMVKLTSIQLNSLLNQ